MRLLLVCLALLLFTGCGGGDEVVEYDVPDTAPPGAGDNADSGESAEPPSDEVPFQE